MCLSMNMVVAVMHTVRVTHLYKLTLGTQKADGGRRVKKMGGLTWCWYYTYNIIPCPKVMLHLSIIMLEGEVNLFLTVL